MKKILCLALALFMVLSLSLAGFAAEKEEKSFEVLKEAKILSDNHEKETAEVIFGDSLAYMIALEGGKSKAFGDEAVRMNAKEDSESFKLSCKWDKGGEYIEKAEIAPFFSKVGEKEEVFYGVVISTKEAPKETEAKDIIGTITVKSKDFLYKKDADAKAEKEQTFDVAFTISNETASEDATTDETKVYKFGEGEDEHEIALFAEMGSFTVDTRGQDDLVIETDVMYNEGIENALPDANYVYFNGNGATFNKIGTLSLNAEEGSFLYRVNSDGTLKLSRAPYDEDDEAFKVRTRVLGSYVISERELDTEKLNSVIKSFDEKEEEKTEEKTEAVPVNPATGIVF